MNFERDAKSTGRVNLLTGGALIAALVVLQFTLFRRPDASLALILGMWVIVGFVAFVFLYQGFSLFRIDGKWQISINQDGIYWESPNETIDKSFNYDLAELAGTETQRKRKRSGNSKIRRYFLVLKNGDRQKLSPNSGVNLVQVITELERLGIENKLTYA